MEEWKDPQQRAEEEDAARSMPFCEQVDRWLHGDAPQECRECEDGKYAELCDGSDRRGYDTLAVDGGADSREKLEADVRKLGANTWWVDKVLDWLDRQAAIAERETVKQWEEQASELARHANELEAERDELKAELRECDEQRLEYRDQRDHLQGEVDTLTASRDRWRKLARERCELLRQVWLKDADGKPLHIGESRYGEDGTGWRVTGFRWGSSHPVQGVDATGRRRDLKPEWLHSEMPDTWERVRSELVCLMVNLSMYGSKYAGDPDAELDAILERARGLAGGSE